MGARGAGARGAARQGFLFISTWTSRMSFYNVVRNNLRGQSAASPIPVKRGSNICLYGGAPAAGAAGAPENNDEQY